MSPLKKKIIFMGSPAFAVPSLLSLAQAGWEIAAVITQPDRVQGRGLKAKSSPVKLLAESLDLRVFQPEKIKNDPALLGELKALSIDLIILVSYGKILPPELLSLPAWGSLNLHASFLPRHRGASPIQGAILSGDRATGLTLMKMIGEVDAGPILAVSRPVPIEPMDTTFSLSQKLAPLGAKLLVDNLPAYFAGLLPQIPQEERLATFTKVIKKEDALIDWQKSASTIEREIRAYNPWPIAFSFWPSPKKGSLLIRFYRAEARAEKSALKAGEVGTWNQSLVIGTGEGTLLVRELQLQGKKRLTGESFLRGQGGLKGSFLH